MVSFGRRRSITTCAPLASNGFEVQFALAAVELAEFWQVVVLGCKILLGGCVPLGSDANELIRTERETERSARSGEMATFVMSAGTSTTRPTESVNCTVVGAGSSVGVGASVATGASVAAVSAGFAVQANAENASSRAINMTSAFFMMLSSCFIWKRVEPRYPFCNVVSPGYPLSPRRQGRALCATAENTETQPNHRRKEYVSRSPDQPVADRLLSVDRKKLHRVLHRPERRPISIGNVFARYGMPTRQAPVACC
jgi:hypothetical protein